MEFERLLADRTERMGVNAIREILKVVSQRGMASLADYLQKKDVHAKADETTIE